MKRLRMLAKALAMFSMGLVTIAAAQKDTPANLKIDFNSETVGAEAKSFPGVVGFWVVAKDGDKHVLLVDGRKWQSGHSSAGLADKARALYGERYAEFLDSVSSFAYFPYAVARDVDDFRAGEITLRFKPMQGRIDQAGGILFNLKTNGDYLALRANALENNLVLWKFEKGKRTSVKWVRNTPTASQQWHVIKLTVEGTKVTGHLDGKLLLEHTLPEPVSGRVGIWSKADSVTYFDDFTVNRAQ